MNDLISRSALINEICSTESEVGKNAPFDAQWFTRMQDRQNEIIDLIKRAPSVKAVRKGRWIFIDSGNSNIKYYYQCSDCKGYNNGITSYCPHCGADMRGD